MLSGPPQSIWSSGDTTTLEERTQSPSSHFFTMVTLQPWVTLDFQLSNPVNTNGCRSSLNWVPDSVHTGVLYQMGKNVFSLPSYSGSLKVKESWFPASQEPSPCDGISYRGVRFLEAVLMVWVKEKNIKHVSGFLARGLKVAQSCLTLQPHRL